MRNFDEWLAAFRPSIADYKYYVDFNKVVANVEAIKIPLNILNSLVGSKNFRFRHGVPNHQRPERKRTACGCRHVCVVKVRKAPNAKENWQKVFWDLGISGLQRH